MRGSVLILVAVVSCTPQIVSQDGGAPGAGGANGSGGAGGGGVTTGGSSGGSFGLPSADAAGSIPDTAPSAPSACAQSKVGAQQVQVDLLILLDNSTSMRNAAGARSKWNTAQAALAAFVMDPASAGLGVGLAFFPHPPPTQGCTSDAQCPSGDCFANDFCKGDGELSNYSCFPAGLLNRCPLGGTCTPGGLCAIGKQPCHALDAPCSSTPGDICQRQAGICDTDGEDSCDVAAYQQPSVAIAALPANQATLVGAINARAPVGGTPTGVALRGAYQHVRAHLAANPGRRVAVILATDGVPTGTCMPTDPPGIAGEIRTAQMGAPSVLTYVIGVFSSQELAQARPTLELFATAGGTGTPYLLDAGANLGMRLNEALAAIRGQSLPCEFTIPPGMSAIDFGKVNVNLEVAGAEQTVPYVEAVGRCDPMRGGWYYDVPPASGTPTRILVCPASCTRFKGAAEAKVNLVFGCKTQVID